MECFNIETIGTEDFKIVDSKSDNSCFYKSFINSICDNMIIEEEMSRIIQTLCYNWVINNRDKYIEEFNCKVEYLVYLTHNIDIEEYINVYNNYAEDYIENVQERWGGLLEQIALSEIFKISIFIYTPQKYDINKNKIYVGKIQNNKPHKGVRYKLLQQIGLKYYNNNPICLLWKDGKYGAHYMTLKIDNNYKINNKGIPIKK